MPKISLSDGRVLDVPDGLTPEQMEETLRRHLMPPEPVAPAPAATPRDVNRSPRAMPLPPTEFVSDDELVPAEMKRDFFPARRPPRVRLAYANAKQHLGRTR